MPERRTIQRARRDRRQGKSPSTQAGEFVREQIHHIREGRHGARSAKQAIAIGLSQARRAGVDLPPPAKGKASARTRRSAKLAYDAGHGHPHRTVRPASHRRRSRAIERALRRESRSAASHTALSRHARAAAKKRTAAERSRSARAASRTKGPAARRAAARKAAQTRSHSRSRSRARA